MLYKSKYLIGVYKALEDDDSLVCLCESVHQFARFFDLTSSDASSVITYAFKNKGHRFKWRGETCEIVFIDEVFFKNEF